MLPSGLRAFDPAVAKRSADVHDLSDVVDVAQFEREPFARPQPGRGREQHERPEPPAESVRERPQRIPRFEWSLLDAGRWRFVTPCLAGLLFSIPQLTARESVWRSAWWLRIGARTGSSSSRRRSRRTRAR
jgi:hypothetical protein